MNAVRDRMTFYKLYPGVPQSDAILVRGTAKKGHANRGGSHFPKYSLEDQEPFPAPNMIGQPDVHGRAAPPIAPRVPKEHPQLQHTRRWRPPLCPPCTVRFSPRWGQGGLSADPSQGMVHPLSPMASLPRGVTTAKGLHPRQSTRHGPHSGGVKRPSTAVQPPSTKRMVPVT
jgi:hypothetical protein